MLLRTNFSGDRTIRRSRRPSILFHRPSWFARSGGRTREFELVLTVVPLEYLGRVRGRADDVVHPEFEMVVMR
jgi:hypothetical protein